MKQIFFLFFLLVSLNNKAQDLELIHNISSSQTYQVLSEEDENLTIYLDFYSPGIIDYKVVPYFFVTGWYELDEHSNKHNLVGIYHPFESLVLFVPEDSSVTRIECLADQGLNLDTTKYLERFYFSLNDNIKRSVWFDGHKEKSINKIDFDKKNVCHTVFIKLVDQAHSVNQSIDITDFVISPFGNNDIFLEDYNIKIYSYNSDSAGNLHILLFITNEYVIPSSLSSGGYYYLMFDKDQSIRRNNYFETYNQGKYISSIDESFIHPTKKKFLIIADWSDSQIIGSFFIEHSKIQIENEW
tara:strand:- start:127 stop:1023 length:897 start_codon:yes stop_codon:yes gene_type:complete